ncbi:MAG: hypothetical protein ABI559_09665 [Chloroflexota bacterium]
MNRDGTNPLSISGLDNAHDEYPDWQPLPPSSQLVWGDNYCSSAYDAVDALYTLLHEAQLGVTPLGCPEFGKTLHTVAFGERIWGDLNCSDGIDAPDVLLLLAGFAGLTPGNPQDCPLLGSVVALQPG